MDKEFWYKKTEKKFLHNIDTFYYSVKLCQDFTRKSDDKDVLLFRNMVHKYQSLDTREIVPFTEVLWKYPVNYQYGCFDAFYNFILSIPEKFDVCIAPIVPPSESGSGSLTSEIIVMLRSRTIWESGVHAAYEDSMEFINLLCDKYRLKISEVKENRVDFCWHTNALQDPESYFNIDNFSRMQVSRFKGVNMHYHFINSRQKPRGPETLQCKDDEQEYYYRSIRNGSMTLVDEELYSHPKDHYYELDYIALGKRGDKCFVRIYLKTKEVVEMGYKSWFFYTWFFHGLISRYDLYVLTEAYKKRSWRFVDIARLQFALNENDELTNNEKSEIRRLLKENKPDYIAINAAAKKYTPEITKIMNVEFQTTRRYLKSFKLLPFKDNQKKGAEKRIYDLFDNRREIINYMTNDTLRLVKSGNDSNKSRADYTDFWKRLRGTKIVDVFLSKHKLKLQRQYSSQLDLEVRKKRAIRSVSAFAITLNRNPENTIYQDASELLAVLNDNDFYELYQYKQKYIRQFKEGDEIPETTRQRNISIFDQETGGIYE